MYFYLLQNWQNSKRNSPLWEQYIERLSEYMESSGKGYKNHAATIRRWANADKKKEEPPVRNRVYGVEEKPYDRDYRRSPGGH